MADSDWAVAGPGAVDYAGVPDAICSQPPIGTGGLSEHEARETAAIDVYISSFTPMKYSLSGRDEKTIMKVIVDRKTDRVLGAHMIGPSVGEMIHEIVTIMEFGGSSEDIARTCHAHPTFSEAVKEAAMAAAGTGPIHS